MNRGPTHHLLLATLALLACVPPAGPPAEPPPQDLMAEIRGGTRLKAPWVLGPDGLARPDHFFGYLRFEDALLGVPCAFDLAADGKLRCLPSGERTEQSGSYWIEFADAACSVAVATWDFCEPPPPFHVAVDSTTCPTRRRVHALGAQRASSELRYFLDGYGECRPGGNFYGGPAFDLGEELPPSAFVEAILRDGPTRGGVTPSYLEASDGARQPVGMRAHGMSAATYPTRLTDGTWRLLPGGEGASVSGHYADPGCREPAAWVYGACPPATAPTYALEWPDPTRACGQEVAVYSVGAPLDSVYQCSGYFLPGTGFKLGDAVPLEAFPAGVPLEHQGRFSLDGGRYGGAWDWSPIVVDGETGAEVAPRPAPGGGERWLPRIVETFTTAQRDFDRWYFADQACTVHLAAVSLSSTRALCRPGLRLVSEVAEACGAPVRLRALGAAHVGAVYARIGLAGSCFPVADANHYFLLGDEVPPERFAVVVRTLQ